MSGAVGEAQDLANSAVDAAQGLVNVAVDLGEEAARDVLQAALIANKLLAEAIEKLGAAVVGK